MGRKETIISFLKNKENFCCDDCISNNCGIFPRQSVYQACTELYNKGIIIRENNDCILCGKTKKCSSYISDYSNNYKTKTLPKLTLNNHNNNMSNKEKPAKEQEISTYNPLEKKLLKLNLEFERYNIVDKFSEYNSHTLEEILNKDKYKKLKNVCYKKYSNYLNISLGKFLAILKSNNDLYYKNFLNPYGDLSYCKFRLEPTPLTKCKGIYIYKIDNEIKYIGRVLDGFNNRINNGYANISPKNCYIDGQATNCHINALINETKDIVNFYIVPLDNDDEICSFERKLIKDYQPEWNIALK